MKLTLEPKNTAIQESAMGGLKTTGRSGKKESGFALVLAILSLMLLTFLGLTLATTTSTELQIATNYRWSQQALYNAEAGIEFGKTLLANMNWQAVLPAARTAAPWDGATLPAGQPTAPLARPDQWGEPTRNFENWTCDRRGNGMGYGVVLDDGVTASAPFQNVTNILGQDLNGSVTLWIRRPVLPSETFGTFADYAASADNLVLVAEGIAPQRTTLGVNRAVRVIEVMLSRVTTASDRCGTRSGQVGGGSEGAGFGGCSPVTGAGVGGALGTTVNEISPTAN